MRVLGLLISNLEQLISSSRSEGNLIRREMDSQIIKILRICMLQLLVVSLLVYVPAESKSCSKSSRLHRKTFRSPLFSLRPGAVQVRYDRMEFPSGHLGVKNFMAEVVDELGTPVPLTKIYLHHWAVFQYHVLSSKVNSFRYQSDLSSSSAKIAGNNGICQNRSLSQFWGLGSETRHTDYRVPGSYAIRVGDPATIPEGFEEVWILNVHAINLQETEDTKGCLECRCDLYKATEDELGRPLRSGYRGGFNCCHEGTRCKVRDGSEGPSTNFYMEYTIEWVEWDECVLPVQIYVFDVTDDGVRDPKNIEVGCQSEYDVPACENDAGAKNDCVHELKTHLVIPKGGNLVYAVAHQHAGSLGLIVHGQDGRHVCSSIPVYGKGTAAGDEAGHVVGMSTCSPEIGAVSLEDGETIHIASYYNSTQGHTGCMGLFYVLVTNDESSGDAQINLSKTHANVTASLIATIAAVVVLGGALGIYIRSRQRLYEPL